MYLYVYIGTYIRASAKYDNVFFRFGLVGREVRVQAVRQGVPVETEPEAAHPGGPVRQGPAARLSPLRHELQAHQPPEQARHTVPAHRV